MKTKAKSTQSRGVKARCLTKEFPFPGTAVSLRRPKDGTGRIRPQGDLEARRRRLLNLAGSCPDFPEASGHPAVDVPRVFAE